MTFALPTHITRTESAYTLFWGSDDAYVVRFDIEPHFYTVMYKTDPSQTLSFYRASTNWQQQLSELRKRLDQCYLGG